MAASWTSAVRSSGHCSRGGVFLIHCHVVPATDPEVRQMIEFRDLLRSDPRPREAYAADKQRITVGISDSLDYTRRLR
jgi:GrpB-like predicted nucleotidyltransferase (UPF0157 family)